MNYDVVIPSTGRDSLAALLDALAASQGPAPGRIIVVDDRRGPQPALTGCRDAEVLRGPARGPAAARNVGWRASQADWIAFLDDDVMPSPGWRAALQRDLLHAPPDLAASQGRITVPLPTDRRPTDWERNVSGLQRARWATADMAFRRRALQAVGGFDERFARAYREDSDIALRLLAAGLKLTQGQRQVSHPVRPAGAAVSLRLQAGNADDVLVRWLHGPRWRARSGAPRGRLRRHLLVTAAGLGAVGVRRAGLRRGCAVLWAAGTAELAWRRIAPGSRTRTEIATMLWTSALMPPLASWHYARGHLRLLSREARRGPQPDPSALPPLAVLLDRDGTLIEDVPYNGDPARVRPLPGVAPALARLRAAEVKLAVISNQSGLGRGWIDERQLAAVNVRIEQLLGPLGPWLICPHAPDGGCDCRKPAPGLVLRAARTLGVAPWRCAVIGDIGADVLAARRAGARAILVPTAATRREEIVAAPELAASLGEAVQRLIGDSCNGEAVAA